MNSSGTHHDTITGEPIRLASLSDNARPGESVSPSRVLTGGISENSDGADAWKSSNRTSPADPTQINWLEFGYVSTLMQISPALVEIVLKVACIKKFRVF